MLELIKDLWNGRVPLKQAFWQYAVAYGLLVNLATSFLFLAVLVNGAAVVFLILAFVLPVPFNLFVVIAVWRSADQYQGPRKWADLARVRERHGHDGSSHRTGHRHRRGRNRRGRGDRCVERWNAPQPPPPVAERTQREPPTTGTRPSGHASGLSAARYSSHVVIKEPLHITTKGTPHDLPRIPHRQQSRLLGPLGRRQNDHPDHCSHSQLIL